MNIISLIGRLTENPEIKSTTTGKSVISANIAVDRPFAKDVTDFIPVVIWNQAAEYIGKYASKGTKVAVTGKLTTRKYEDKNGNKRTAYEVVVDTVEICETRSEPTVSVPPNMPNAYAPGSVQMEEIPTDGDLPF